MEAARKRVERAADAARAEDGDEVEITWASEHSGLRGLV